MHGIVFGVIMGLAALAVLLLGLITVFADTPAKKIDRDKRR